MLRSLRWLFLAIWLGCLIRIFVADAGAWTLGFFFGGLAAWYWLTWRRQRELDHRGDYKPREWR